MINNSGAIVECAAGGWNRGRFPVGTKSGQIVVKYREDTNSYSKRNHLKSTMYSICMYVYIYTLYMYVYTYIYIHTMYSMHVYMYTCTLYIVDYSSLYI